jgi:hypothetical protein
MSKELEALENIRKLFIGSPIDLSQQLDLIETALKRLEVYENYNINLNETDDVDKALELKTRIIIVDKVMDTQERLLASVSADEIRILSSVLNSQTRNLKKKLKALDIIKNKKVNVRAIFKSSKMKEELQLNSYNNQTDTQEEDLTIEEYNLLKEVLKNG